MLLQEARGGTFCRNPEFHRECQSTPCHCRVPVLQALCRKCPKVHLPSRVLMFPGLRSERACFSCPHAHCTISSEAPILQDRFCKVFSCQSVLPLKNIKKIPANRKSSRYANHVNIKIHTKLISSKLI